MKMPKELFVVYNFGDIEFVTEDEDEAIKFVECRITNYFGEVINDHQYKGIKITDAYEIEKILNEYDYCRGEYYGGILFSNPEFEMLSDYIANMNTTLLYGVENSIIKKLKYFKLNDYDKKIILKALSIIIDKINLIEEGPTEDDDYLYDEEDVYNLDILAEDFFNDMITPP